MNYNWKWEILVQSPYLEWLATGFVWTVQISFLAWIIAFTVGSIVGIVRTVPIPLARTLGAAYVEAFRNVPLLVQMFLWFFVLPELVPDELGRWMKRDMPFPEASIAVLCLGFYTASRVAEQVRAGIESVGRGLSNAALASGMTFAQSYRHVVLPIAYRIIVPPMTSEFLGIFKNSSLALTIGVLELTAMSRQIENYTFQGYEAFTAATVLYISIATVLLIATKSLERRTRVPGMIARESS